MYNLLKINSNNENHIEILYKLLTKKKFNISHETLPLLDHHKIFVKNNPYREWYFIQKSSEIIGSVYITKDNVIGINIPEAQENEYLHSIKLIIEKHNPLEAIKSVRSKSFCINSNPKNKVLIKALEKLNMEHIENTYRFKD